MIYGNYPFRGCNYSEGFLCPYLRQYLSILVIESRSGTVTGHTQTWFKLPKNGAVNSKSDVRITCTKDVAHCITQNGIYHKAESTN